MLETLCILMTYCFIQQAPFMFPVCLSSCLAGPSLFVISVWHLGTSVIQGLACSLIITLPRCLARHWCVRAEVGRLGINREGWSGVGFVNKVVCLSVVCMVRVYLKVQSEVSSLIINQFSHFKLVLQVIPNKFFFL